MFIFHSLINESLLPAALAVQTIEWPFPTSRAIKYPIYFHVRGYYLEA